MVDNHEDDADFDTMLEDCAEGLDTKIETQATLEKEVAVDHQSENEPTPLKSAPQMHVMQPETLPQSTNNPAPTLTTDASNPVESEDPSVDMALDDF